MNNRTASDIAPYLLDTFDFDSFDFIQLLNDFDQGVLMTDKNGIMIFYNATQANIDNLNPADVIGKKITEVYRYHNDSSTCMRVLKHHRPIINYALSYSSQNANVGNTIHSVFPLFKDGIIAGTICFVKDYNILERNIPAFLEAKNNEKFAKGTKFTFASIIGTAPPFVNALRTAKMAANSPSPVMLYGETGTGKELFAQAIHNFHHDKQKEYVDINCAAIPETLLEGILFGSVKGAYTGAIDRAGLFESANGGTIYLDEINSMPLALQGKLLRVLQEKQIRRVGSLENTPLNCKVICSINESPRQMIKNGTFRMDLFYRLAVIYVHVPPLRERLVDIEELGRHFLQKYSNILGKDFKYISEDVIEFFWNYSWPGNVRELEHIIESAVSMAGNNEKILRLEHCYFSDLLGILDEPVKTIRQNDFQPYRTPTVHKPAATITTTQSLAAATSAMEKEKIINALTMSGGNIAAASRKLSMSRQLLSHKISKLELRSQLNEIRYRTTTE